MLAAQEVCSDDENWRTGRNLGPQHVSNNGLLKRRRPCSKPLSGIQNRLVLFTHTLLVNSAYRSALCTLYSARSVPLTPAGHKQKKRAAIVLFSFPGYHHLGTLGYPALENLPVL